MKNPRAAAIKGCGATSGVWSERSKQDDKSAALPPSQPTASPTSPRYKRHSAIAMRTGRIWRRTTARTDARSSHMNSITSDPTIAASIPPAFTEAASNRRSLARRWEAFIEEKQGTSRGGRSENDIPPVPGCVQHHRVFASGAAAKTRPCVFSQVSGWKERPVHIRVGVTAVTPQGSVVQVTAATQQRYPFIYVMLLFLFSKGTSGPRPVRTFGSGSCPGPPIRRRRLDSSLDLGGLWDMRVVAPRGKPVDKVSHI